MSSNYSPYSGDVFHEVLLLLAYRLPCVCVFLQQALVLTVFQWLTSLGEWAVGAFFIVSETSLCIREHRGHYIPSLQSVDVVIAVCLAGIADLHMKDQVRLYYHMDCELHPPLTKLSVEERDQGEEELWKGSD